MEELEWLCVPWPMLSVQKVTSLSLSLSINIFPVLW
jgi:hypothetical protein